MNEDRFITLAIHTYERAVALRKILEDHGISVRFEKLVITGSGIMTGIRVKINEHDLPLALKLTESCEIISPMRMEMKMEGTRGNVLIPVDFSPNSMIACRVGFDLARRLSLHPVIMHAYATPYFNGALASDESLDGSMMPDPSEEIAEVEAGIDFRKDSERRMEKLRRQIEGYQKEGSIPGIKFSTVINEGIPEDVIKEYCRLTPPELVVMATRSKEKREEAMIGSVTAEVLDSCRVPVLAIPEKCNMPMVEEVRNLVYFCNLDQQDMLSVDTLMRMFDYPEVNVTLVPVNERAVSDLRTKVDMLKDYFNKSYPAAHFTVQIFPAKTFRADFENFVNQTGVEMLIVPNKKRSIFRRLFNPGIAHKLLFERETPLLALPV